MDQHAKWTFAIGNVYAKWAQQVCLFFSVPGHVNDDGNWVLNEVQPTPEEKAEHLRDAEAHGRMVEFCAAMGAIEGPDAEITNVPED